MDKKLKKEYRKHVTKQGSRIVDTLPKYPAKHVWLKGILYGILGLSLQLLITAIVLLAASERGFSEYHAYLIGYAIFYIVVAISMETKEYRLHHFIGTTTLGWKNFFNAYYENTTGEKYNPKTTPSMIYTAWDFEQDENLCDINLSTPNSEYLQNFCYNIGKRQHEEEQAEKQAIEAEKQAIEAEKQAIEQEKQAILEEEQAIYEEEQALLYGERVGE
jgi:hypothetical protein